MTHKSKSCSSKQIRSYYRLLLIAIFFFWMGNKTNAQWGGGNFVSVGGNQITADTCAGNTGSFEIFSRNGQYSSVIVTNSLGTTFNPSPNNPILFENLPSGTYTLMPIPFDPFDIPTTDIVVIDAVSNFSLNAQIIQPTCFVNGSINLTPVGNSTYTYLWSDNRVTSSISLIPGNYSLTVVGTSATGCTVTETFNINTQNTETVHFYGCGSYVYNGITYTQSTIINETLTNNGCNLYRTVHINIYPANSFQLSSSKNVFHCNDSSLLCVTGSTSNHISSINWLRNGSSIFNNSVNTLVTTAGTTVPGSSLNQLNNPLGVAFDALGNMYVGDWNNHRVMRYPPGSTLGTTGIVVAGGNGLGAALDQLNRPAGIYVRGNFLYVCDYNNKRVMKYDISPSATFNGTGTIVAKRGLHLVNEVFVTPSGEIYVSQHVFNYVTKFPANSDEFTWGTTVAGANPTNALNILDNPVGIYVASNNDLFIADKHNHRILKWAAGATSGVIVAGGNGPGSALNQLNNPVDVDFDAAGNMYVSEETGARVMYFLPGSNQYSSGAVYLNNNSLNLVGHIAFDLNGNLNTADAGNNRVVKIEKQLCHWVKESGIYSAEIIMDNGCTSITGPIIITSSLIVARDTQRINQCNSYIHNNVTYTTSTTIRDTIKTIQGACDSVYKVIIITIKQPTASTTNTSICSSSLPYSWNNNTYTQAGTYNVVLTNAVGCDSTATLNLNVNVCCQPTSSITDIAICSNTLPFSWNGNSYTQAGTYNVVLTNASGCDSTATLILTIKQPTSSTTNTSICSSSLPYSWNNNTYIQAGTYNVVLTNAAGCDSTATLNLTVNNTSPIVFTVPVDTCANTNAIVGTAGSFSSYNWTLPNNSISNTPTVSGSQYGTYTLTATNSFGCTSTNSITMKNCIPPVVTITGDLTICFEETTVLTAAVAGYPTATYEWILPGGGNSFDNPLNVSNGGQYTVIATLPNGTTITNNVFVAASTPITYTVSGTNLCYGVATGNFDVTVTGGISPFTYSWTNNTTNAIVTTQDIFNVPNNQIYFGAITDANACSTPVTLAFNILNDITLVANGTTFACGATNGTVTLTIGGGLPFMNAQGNQYYMVNNQIFYINGSNTFTANIGTSTITVVDAAGCTKQFNITTTAPCICNIPQVSISTIGSLPINVNGTARYCYLGTIKLEASFINSATYTWYFGNNPTPVATGRTLIISNATPTNNGKYYVIALLGANCISKAEIDVVVYPKFTIATSQAIVNVCPNSAINLNNYIAPPVAVASYQWFKAGIPVNTNQTITSSNTGFYSVIATNTLSCQSNIASVTVNMYPVASPVITAPAGMCLTSNPIQISATPAGGTWSHAGRVTITNTGIVTPANSGSTTITYTVANGNGCAVSVATRSFFVYATPAVPTIAYTVPSPLPSPQAPSGCYCRNRTFGVYGTPTTNGVWSITGGAATITPSPNATYPSRAILSSGNVLSPAPNSVTLTYTYSDANGCRSSRQIQSCVVACIPKAVVVKEPISMTLKYNIYPNPAKNIVNIKVDNVVGETQVVFRDIMGKVLQQKVIGLGVNTFDVSTYSKGMYLVSIITKDETKTEKIIVE